MRVDSVILDTMLTLKQLVLAMDNRLTAVENFAPEGVAGEVLMSNGPNTPPSYQALDAEDSVVTSVFGRSGAVIAQTGDYEFDQIAFKPTTLAGYGITDAYTKLEIDALLLALSLTDLDDVTITAPVVTQVLRHSGVEWVNAVLAFSDLSGSIADGQVPQSAVTQHQAALSIGWSQITGTPTTLAGYGITDAYTQAQVDALIAALSLDSLSDVVITAPVTGEVLRYNGASWVDAVLAPLDLSGWPANAAGVLTNDGAGVLTWGAGGGTVSSVFGRTGAVVATAGDYDAFYFTEAEVTTLTNALDARLDVLETNQLRLYVERDTSSQALTTGTTTTILFNQENTDTDSAYNPGTGLYVAPTAGIYLIDVSLAVDAVAGAAPCQATIEVNGVIHTLFTLALYAGVNAYGSGQLIRFLSASDNVRVRVAVPAGVTTATLRDADYCRRSIHRLQIL